MTTKTTAPEVHEQLAELNVAAQLADAGWEVFLPYRDRGFDLIAARKVGRSWIVRPIQVKGRYLQKGYRRDRENEVSMRGRQEGARFPLSEPHNDLVVALVYVDTDPSPIVLCTAYLPFKVVKKSVTRQTQGRRNHRVFWPAPAQWMRHADDSVSLEPKPEFDRFFDGNGIRLMARSNWSNEKPQNKKRSR